MTEYNKEKYAQVHVLVPRDIKEALDKIVPKGQLSNIVRRFLINFLRKLRSPDEHETPFDAATGIVVKAHKKEAGDETGRPTGQTE